MVHGDFRGCREGLAARLVLIFFEDVSWNLAVGMWQYTMWCRSLGFDVHYLKIGLR
jgi:hypothetical protein